MNKTCVGCAKAIPVAARNCFFCGVRQPAVSTTIPTSKPVTSVIGHEGKEKKVTESAPSQTKSTMVNVDVNQLSALREILARRDADEKAEAAAKTPAKTNPTEAMPASLEAALAGAAEANKTPPRVDAMPEAGKPRPVEAKPEPKAEPAPIVASPEAKIEAPVESKPAPAADDVSLNFSDADEPEAATPVKAPAVAPAAGDRANDNQPTGDDETDPAVPLPRGSRALPWAVIARGVMAVGGVLLLVLFARAASLLPVFHGTVLAMHQLFLVGGVLLLGASALPLPGRARGVMAASLGALAVLVATTTVTGFGGVRGLFAGVGFLALPGGLLLRARLGESLISRALVAVGVVVGLALYFIPVDGVMPVRAVLSLLTSGSTANAVASVLLFVPFALALVAIRALVGKSEDSFGALWAVLLLVLAPLSVMVLGGASDDSSLVQLGVALLATGGTVAVGMTEALLPDAPRAA